MQTQTGVLQLGAEGMQEEETWGGRVPEAKGFKLAVRF